MNSSLIVLRGSRRVAGEYPDGERGSASLPVSTLRLSKIGISFRLQNYWPNTGVLPSMRGSTEVKATNVAELIALLKAEPGKLTYGSAGIGMPPHLSGELFKAMAGVQMDHVPYRGGGPAMTDLIGGQMPSQSVKASASCH